MQVWNTKYALTKGITKEEVQKIDGNVVRVNEYFYLHGEGKEWHRTYEGAVARAEELRLAKIRSLKKKLNRLERMRF